MRPDDNILNDEIKTSAGGEKKKEASIFRIMPEFRSNGQKGKKLQEMRGIRKSQRRGTIDHDLKDWIICQKRRKKGNLVTSQGGRSLQVERERLWVSTGTTTEYLTVCARLRMEPKGRVTGLKPVNNL